MSSRDRWVFVWVLALLPLLGWWLYGLFDIDEGSYAAVVAEMNRRGEWITPLYNGKPWFEKPILLYWLAKPCLIAFGDMVGPRLPCVLTALGTYGVVAWFANRRFGVKVAQLATLMVAGSLLVIALGRMMMTDMPLLLCLTAAMATFWESLVGRASWRVWTAGLLGLGVLAKGPVALILFALIAGWTYWREPELRAHFRGFWLKGTALLVVVIASWYVPAYLANGQVFVQKFLIEQNVGRFTGGDAAHTIPGIGGFLTGLGMYLGVLLVGMAPWSVFLWKAWPRARSTVGGEKGLLRKWFSPPLPVRLRASDSPTSPPEGRGMGSISAKEVERSTQVDDQNYPFSPGASERYLAAWAGVVFVFFAISGAKLVHYILPMFPPLAILVAAYAVRCSPRLKRWYFAAAGWCVLMAVVANVGFLWWFRSSGQAEVQGIARFVRKEGGPVAIYQMSRRNADLGTGKLKLQETNLPSLLMYLDKDALETDDFKAILKSPPPIWIITRENRIHPADFVAAQRSGRQLVEVKPPVPQAAFSLYIVR